MTKAVPWLHSNQRTCPTRLAVSPLEGAMESEDDGDPFPECPAWKTSLPSCIHSKSLGGPMVSGASGNGRERVRITRVRKLSKD
jgi:hypothetical protein